MTREEAKTVFLNRGYVEVDNGTYYNPDKWREACAVISEWLKQDPCEDAISRQAVINAIANTCFWLSANNWEELMKCINSISPINPQPDALQFANWVASEIFDENWEYNKDAFAELACRKLAKLGIVKANGDEWELIESQTESEDKPVVHGEWIERIVRGEKALYCSVCNDGLDVLYHYNFCPNCGADMREEKS